MSIGENIKKYRKEQKLTQPKLGSMISKSESSVRKYESGDVVPDIKTLKDIALALKVSLSDLIEGGAYINISGSSGEDREMYLHTIAPHEDFKSFVEMFENLGYEIRELVSPEEFKIEVIQDDKSIACINLSDFIQLGKTVKIILNDLEKYSKSIVENLIEQYDSDPEK